MKVFSALRSSLGTKGSEISLRQDSPEMDWFVAHATLEQFAEKKDLHDLQHGVNHLASLLAADPALPASVELLDGYRKASGGKLLSILPPQQQQAYFAIEALRAHAFADEGRFDEAIDLMLQVQRAKPDAGYLETWGVDWMERAMDTLPPQLTLFFFGNALMAFPEHKVLVQRREGRIRRIVALAQRIAPKMSGPQWDMTFIGLHRKAGLFDDAIRLAKSAIELRPTWESFTALGLALRGSGSMKEAAAAFAKAIEHQPDDLAALLETGDGWFDRAEWKTARTVYERVLGKEPHHSWAEPSALFCAWRETSPHAPSPDERFPQRIRQLAQEGNGRARGLLGAFRPWQGMVPIPTDATAGSLREMERQGGTPGRVAVTDVESPSNEIAFALYARMKNVAPPGIDYGNVAKPDPRKPVEPIAFELYRLHDDRVVPALAPPPDDVRAAIELLAVEPFDMERSWAKASRLGASFGPTRARDVLACMVHPSPPPATFHGGVVDWIARVQLAAAEVVAHVDDGWDDSTRRAALFSMLLGPRDWVTTAAIVVLTNLAHEHPVIALDVDAAFRRLEAARPDRGGMTYELALYWNWQSLPFLFPNEREELSKKLDDVLG